MTKEIEEKKKWRKIGGGTLRLLDGTRIKPSQHFEARESDIPKAFMNVIEEISTTSRTRTRKPSGKQSKEDQVVEDIKSTPGQYSLKHQGGGRWNVINTEGKPVNDTYLSKKEAETLMQNLV